MQNCSHKIMTIWDTLAKKRKFIIKRGKKASIEREFCILQMLELSCKELKMTVVNMLKDLMEKQNYMCKDMKSQQRDEKIYKKFKGIN